MFYQSCFREEQMSAHSFFREGQMFAHSFSGRGKCLPLSFQGGANVLPLVLGRGKCQGQMSGGGKVRLPVDPYNETKSSLKLQLHLHSLSESEQSGDHWWGTVTAMPNLADQFRVRQGHQSGTSHQGQGRLLAYSPSCPLALRLISPLSGLLALWPISPWPISPLAY